MPQMPRQAAPHGDYHDTASAPDHLYMAAYLYLQQQNNAQALIHLGTHGTQEWLPGKDRGLAADDYPWLSVGALPVFYPSTDHPFEFLGGLSAAVRHLDGKAPQLLISDLRSSEVRTTGLARFLADELRTRYLNPQWVNAMQQEGYAGTLEVLNATNNLFGWQAMDASTVRDDQWQSLFDTYVNDTRELGTPEWFEQHNPTAQAQILERMAEAMRKGYWDASEQTRRALAERWQTLQTDFAVDTGSPLTREFIAELAQGFGLDSPPADAASDAAAPALPAAPATDSSAASEHPLQQVEGQMLAPVEPTASEDPLRQLPILALMLLLILCGGLWQARQHTPDTRLTTREDHVRIH